MSQPAHSTNAPSCQPRRRIADVLGLSRIGQRYYLNRILHGTVYRARILEHEISFQIESPRDLKRIDHLSGELPFLTRIAEGIDPGCRLWDIGANVGALSLALAYMKPRMKIECFEPEPRAFAFLSRNLSLNDMEDRCRAHQIALSNVSGKSQLLVCSEPGSSANSLNLELPVPGAAISVTASRGDDLVATLGAPDALKIDVEGAELLVIDGLRHTLASGTVRDIFIEVHRELLRLADGTSDVGDLLKHFGFRQLWQRQRSTEVHCHFARA